MIKGHEEITEANLGGSTRRLHAKAMVHTISWYIMHKYKSHTHMSGRYHDPLGIVIVITIDTRRALIEIGVNSTIRHPDLIGAGSA